MHDSAKKSFILFKENYLNASNKIKIVEIGSRSVNADIRNTLNNNFSYIGLDIEAGKNVDVVLENPYKFPFEDSSIDVIISISVFEHTEFFWLTFLEILRVLKPQGLFFLNAPSNSKYHRHETDNWRFYPDSGNALINWAKKNNFNPILLESFISKQYLECGWNDYVSITLKDKKYLEIYNDKIISKINNFTNGIDHEGKIYNFSSKSQDQENWGFRLWYKIRKKIDKLRH